MDRFSYSLSKKLAAAGREVRYMEYRLKKKAAKSSSKMNQSITNNSTNLDHIESARPTSLNEEDLQLQLALEMSKADAAQKKSEQENAELRAKLEKEHQEKMRQKKLQEEAQRKANEPSLLSFDDPWAQASTSQPVNQPPAIPPQPQTQVSQTSQDSWGFVQTGLPQSRSASVRSNGPPRPVPPNLNSKNSSGPPPAKPPAPFGSANYDPFGNSDPFATQTSVQTQPSASSMMSDPFSTQFSITSSVPTRSCSVNQPPPKPAPPQTQNLQNDDPFANLNMKLDSMTFNKQPLRTTQSNASVGNTFGTPASTQPAKELFAETNKPNDDPFGFSQPEKPNPPTTQSSDPFGATQNSDPFGSLTQSANVEQPATSSDPFGNPMMTNSTGPAKDPFENSKPPERPADTFATNNPVQADNSTDPFGISTSVAENSTDPFGNNQTTANADPFGTANSLTQAADPFGATNEKPVDPFNSVSDFQSFNTPVADPITSTSPPARPNLPAPTQPERPPFPTVDTELTAPININQTNNPLFNDDETNTADDEETQPTDPYANAQLSEQVGEQTQPQTPTDPFSMDKASVGDNPFMVAVQNNLKSTDDKLDNNQLFSGLDNLNFESNINPQPTVTTPEIPVINTEVTDILAPPPRPVRPSLELSSPPLFTQNTVVSAESQEAPTGGTQVTLDFFSSPSTGASQPSTTEIANAFSTPDSAGQTQTNSNDRSSQF